MLPKTAGLGGGQSISGLQRYLSSGGRDDRQQQPKEKSLKGHAVVIESRAGSKQWIALGLLVAALMWALLPTFGEKKQSRLEIWGALFVGLLVSQPILFRILGGIRPAANFSVDCCAVFHSAF